MSGVVPRRPPALLPLARWAVLGRSQAPVSAAFSARESRVSGSSGRLSRLRQPPGSKALVDIGRRVSLICILFIAENRS